MSWHGEWHDVAQPYALVLLCSPEICDGVHTDGDLMSVTACASRLVLRWLLSDDAASTRCA